MKAFTSLLVVLIVSNTLFGQNKKFIIVKAGENIMNVVPASEVFYYPQFVDGIVFSREGTKTTTKLNYNRLVDEIHFINAKGDTLALANEKNIRFILAGADTFYYDEGFLRILASCDRAKLALKQTWIVADTRQLGAFNTTNTSVSVASFKTVNESGRLYDLTVNADIVLKKIEQYYLGDKNNHFVIATKKNLFSLFPKEESQLDAFLKENKINFTSKEDLEKVVQFIADL